MKRVDIPLLLTATIHPRGMQGAAFTPAERIAMYVDALNFYIRTFASRPQPGGWTLVFAENSGCDPQAVLSRLQSAAGVRVEYLAILPEGFLSSRGKGYNEVLLIERAIARSAAIRSAGCFFKLTGRLKVLNIFALLQECQSRMHSAAGLSFCADCKDHSVYDLLHLPINGHAGECRYWFASVPFFEREIAIDRELLHDYTSPPYLAEDLMLRVCRRVAATPGCFIRFKTQARISGRGGHDLGRGWSFFYSTDNDSPILRFKCGLRQCFRWLLPWWKV